MKELIKDIAIALVIVLCITTLVKPTIVKGSSMEPSFYEGDYLIVNKISYFKKSPQRGDVVVLKENAGNSSMKGKLLIKRVCAIGGDEISVNGSDVSVNGTTIDEKYISDDGYQEDLVETWKVPEGSVFVMGDHRSVSLDSRSSDIGYIKEDDIVGRAVLRLWPFSEIEIIENPFEQ